ncbi:MAG: acyltransferase [Gemmatimonadaceae bacterium]
MFAKSRAVLSSGFQALSERPSSQLPALDALRSFAILLVVFGHWAGVEYSKAGGIATPLQDFPVFYYGWIGVDLFFVLSGFLIGRQLWRELQRTGSIRVGRFILRRGLRIWPIYFVMLLYYALFNPAIQPRFIDWAFLSNYFPSQFSRGWSLSTEEQFYIAIPILLLLLKDRVPLKRFIGVLLGIEAAVLLNRYRVLRSFLAAGGSYNTSDFVLIYPFHVHLEGLLAGLLIALLSVVVPSALTPPATESGVSWKGLAVLASTFAIGFALRRVSHEAFAFLALGLIFGGLTYFALVDRSALTRWLGWRFWHPISRLSYSMYLNHFWFWPASNHWIVSEVSHFTTSPNVLLLVTMALGTIASFLFAGVMFITIEHPFLLWRDRILTTRSEPDHARVSSPSLGSAV